MTTPPDIPVLPRPTPLREAAALWSKVHGAIGGVITALVTAGILTAGQGASLTHGSLSLDALISAAVGVVTAGTAVAAAFSTAKTAEPAVTPLADPRDATGRALVPAATGATVTLTSNAPATPMVTNIPPPTTSAGNPSGLITPPGG
ncbi:MAG: hypothetical protein ACRDS0_29500 [Pseudonocardiaceae bacterium]